MLKSLVSKLLLAAVAALTLAMPASAESWPTKPVKIVVPYAAGGGSDTVARMIAERLSKAFGQQFYVENKTGANGTIAADYVARSAPDGYTLFLAVTSQIAIAPAMMNVHYDPAKAFVPISIIITNDFALAVNKNLPVNSVKEFVTYARKQSAPLSYASGGVGSVTSLGMELFKHRTGLKMTNVPYKGAHPALQAVISGEVPAMFAVLSDTLGQVKAGNIKLLAVASPNRAEQVPNVPTLAEQGYPGLYVASWNGLMAPAGTPKEIVDKIAAAVTSAVKDPKFAARLRNFGANPVGSTPKEYKKVIASDIALWGEAVKLAGIERH
jgi:tripartite-type tricarboxylate transporter receptor subunit TctC